ncbi:hypothetical protein U1Q18_023091 [Sarracenia purpurea var. burkii]
MPVFPRIHIPNKQVDARRPRKSEVLVCNHEMGIKCCGAERQEEVTSPPNYQNPGELDKNLVTDVTSSPSLLHYTVLTSIGAAVIGFSLPRRRP